MACKKPSLLASAGFLTFLLCTTSVPAAAEPLDEAVLSALNYHPSVEAAVENRNAYIQQRREEWAGYFPEVSVRASGGRGFTDNSTSRGLQVTRDSAYSYIWEGGVTMTQPLFDGFETTNRVGAADARRESANNDIVDIREELAFRTIMAYLDVLRTREAVAKIQSHGEKIADYQKRIQSMVDEGAADESMIVQARDIRAQLDNTLANMQGQLRAANAKYAELVGHPPSDPMEKPEPPLDALPETMADAVAQARNNHPALHAAKDDEVAAMYDTEAEKQAYFPDVDGELSYLKRDQAEEIGGELLDAKAMVRLNWNFSVAGGEIARVRKTRHRQYESRAKFKEMQRQIEREVRVAYSDLATAREQLRILRERETINEDLFRTYEAQFEGARINLLQLLQSDNALFNARLSRINGEFKLMGAQYSALASMGRLQKSLNVVTSMVHEEN